MLLVLILFIDEQGINIIVGDHCIVVNVHNCVVANVDHVASAHHVCLLFQGHITIVVHCVVIDVHCVTFLCLCLILPYPCIVCKLEFH
jgi:hypothetical protein